jgi:hypothetical protein
MTWLGAIYEWIEFRYYAWLTKLDPEDEGTPD